jgi:hypothetical protein
MSVSGKAIKTHLPTILHIHLCDPPRRHGRALVITAEFFDEGPRQAGVSLQICELFRVLEKGDDA